MMLKCIVKCASIYWTYTGEGCVGVELEGGGESILQRLLTMLDTDDAEVHSKVCEYILDLHR